MNQEEKIKQEYEEIDLMGYVKVILKRKRLILAVFLAGAIIAGVFSFITPKVYKVDTSLEIGKIGGEAGVLESPSQVVEKIKNDVYGGLVREKLKISEANYPKIKIENPKDTNLIKMVTESSKPELAKDILEEIAHSILEGHQEVIKNKKEILEKDIERIKNKIKFLEEEKNNLEAKVEALQRILPYQQTPGTQFALFDAKEKLEVKKQEIENLYFQINSLQRSLDDIKPTQIIKEPVISEKPIKPNFILNTVAAAMLGLFLGIFFAFFAEWWIKAKK